MQRIQELILITADSVSVGSLVAYHDYYLLFQIGFNNIYAPGVVKVGL